MAELAHGTQPEFWRPPSPSIGDETTIQETTPVMAEACPRCGTEFLLGSRFCHTCGGRRPEEFDPAARADAAALAGMWQRAVYSVRSTVSRIPWGKLKLPSLGSPSWLRYLQFHDIRSRLGLSAASMIAFMIGLGCLGGALLVGLLTAKTLADWQAIQFYRVEWLLAATMAFVAGILLKKPSSN